MLDERADAATTINFRPNSSKVKDRRLLSFIRVGKGSGITDYALDLQKHSKYWQHLRNTLIAAHRDLPPDAMQELRVLKARPSQ